MLRTDGFQRKMEPGLRQSLEVHLPHNRYSVHKKVDTADMSTCSRINR